MKIRTPLSLSGIVKSALSKPVTDGFVGLLSQADGFRDSRQYKEAASLYREYLTQDPRNFAIWVQLGNSLKDSDQFDDAERAYKTAIEIEPNDHDVFLQLGHLLKLSGRSRDAHEMYRRSFEIQPSVDSAREISLFDPKAPDVQEILTLSETTNYFYEIDNMLKYMMSHPTLSGIQHVQAEIIQFFSGNDFYSRATHFVIQNSSRNDTTLKKLRNSDLLDLIDFVSADASDHDRIRDLIARAKNDAIAVSPKAGDVYFILGDFWGYDNVVSRYQALKMRGVIFGVYIHDIIPINYPSYCAARLTHDFLLSLGDGLAIFDFALTNSEFTAAELRQFIARNNCRDIPIKPVLLAHIFDSNKHDDANAAETEDDWTDLILPLRNREYVLFVSTIEARKNHDLVMRIWEEMIRNEEPVPDLVFVGRKGWRVDPLFERIEATDHLDGRLHLLHDLSDNEISTVYRNCLFTVFPSFVEGWGLPVGESLVAGRPCVASNTSAIPEVGGDFVDYFNPMNFSEAYAAIRKLCFDKPYRLRRETNIQEYFVPRTWNEVGEDLQRNLIAMSSKMGAGENGVVVKAPYARPLLHEASFFKPAVLRFGARLREDYCKCPMRLALGDGWYEPEVVGCWMQDKYATLEFGTDLSPGQDVLVAAQMMSTQQSAGCRISMCVGENEGSLDTAETARSIKPLGGPFYIMARGVVDDLGGVIVTFELKGEPPKPLNDDPRSLAAGLVSVGYTNALSLESRLNLIEMMLFDT